MDINLYNHVAEETYPHTLWKNLENMYKTKNEDFLDVEADEFEAQGRSINC